MKELTKGTPAKVILFFALPMLLGSVFQQLYNLTDSKIVSLYLGPESLAAVGATTVLTNTLIWFMNGLTQGFAVFVARYFGAQDFDALKKHIAGTFKASVCFAIPIALLGAFFLPLILRLLNTPEDVFADALIYARIIILGMLFVSLYNLCANVLRALGDSKTPLLFLIICVVINIPLDLLFICIFHMGISGTAYATILSQAVSGISCSIYLIKKYPSILPQKGEWKVPITVYRVLLPSGLSMGMMGVLINFGTLVLQSSINGLGTQLLTAQTAARRIFDLMMVAIASIGSSMVMYSSQNLGAGRKDRVTLGVRHAIYINTIITTLLIIFCMLFGHPLMQWLASTDDRYIIENGVMYLRIGIFFFYILGPLFILRNTLQGIGHTIAPIVSACLEMLTKFVFALILVPWLGYLGVALTEPICWCIMIIPLIVVYWRDRFSH